jgi:hypothetical protein
MKIIILSTVLCISSTSFGMQEDTAEATQGGEKLALALLRRHSSGSLPRVESDGALVGLEDAAAEGAAHKGQLKMRSRSGSLGSVPQKAHPTRSASAQIPVPDGDQ